MSRNIRRYLWLGPILALFLLSTPCSLFTEEPQTWAEYEQQQRDRAWQRERELELQQTQAVLALTMEAALRNVPQQNPQNPAWEDVAPDVPSNEGADAPLLSPPVIVRVVAPAVIPPDGTNVKGKLYFTDPDGDVSRARCDVLRGDFECGDWDPRSSLVEGTAQEGAYEIFLWCYGKQGVSLRFTLFDEAGLESNSSVFSFVCA